MENKDEETVKRRIQQYVPDGETGQDLPNRSGVATCFLSSLPHPPTPGMMLSFSSQPQTLSTSTSPLGCTTSLAAVDIMVVSSSEKREYSPCTGHTTSCSSGELMETCPSMMDTSVASDYKSSTLPSASFKVKEAPSKETVEQGEGEEKVPPVVSSVHARGDPQSQLASPFTTPKNEGSTTVNPLPDVPPSVASSEDTSQKGAPPVLPHHAPASHRRRHSSAPLTPTVPSPPNLLVLHQQHQVPTPIVPLPAPCPKRAAQFLSSLAFLRRRRRASSLSSPSSSSSSSSTSTTSSGSRSVRSCTTSSSSSSSSTSSSSSSSFKETKNKALGSGEDRHLPSASHHHHHLHDEHDDHGRGHHKRHRHRRKKKKKKRRTATSAHHSAVLLETGVGGTHEGSTAATTGLGNEVTHKGSHVTGPTEEGLLKSFPPLVGLTEPAASVIPTLDTSTSAEVVPSLAVHTMTSHCSGGGDAKKGEGEMESTTASCIRGGGIGCTTPILRSSRQVAFLRVLGDTILRPSSPPFRAPAHGGVRREEHGGRRHPTVHPSFRHHYASRSYPSKTEDPIRRPPPHRPSCRHHGRPPPHRHHHHHSSSSRSSSGSGSHSSDSSSRSSTSSRSTYSSRRHRRSSSLTSLPSLTGLDAGTLPPRHRDRHLDTLFVAPASSRRSSCLSSSFSSSSSSSRSSSSRSSLRGKLHRRMEEHRRRRMKKKEKKTRKGGERYKAHGAQGKEEESAMVMTGEGTRNPLPTAAMCTTSSLVSFRDESDDRKRERRSSGTPRDTRMGGTGVVSLREEKRTTISVETEKAFLYGSSSSPLITAMCFPPQSPPLPVVSSLPFTALTAASPGGAPSRSRSSSVSHGPRGPPCVPTPPFSTSLQPPLTPNSFSPSTPPPPSTGTEFSPVLPGWSRTARVLRMLLASPLRKSDTKIKGTATSSFSPISSFLEASKGGSSGGSHPTLFPTSMTTTTGGKDKRGKKDKSNGSVRRMTPTNHEEEWDRLGGIEQRVRLRFVPTPPPPFMWCAGGERDVLHDSNKNVANTSLRRSSFSVVGCRLLLPGRSTLQKRPSLSSHHRQRSPPYRRKRRRRHKTQKYKGDASHPLVGSGAALTPPPPLSSTSPLTPPAVSFQLPSPPSPVTTPTRRTPSPPPILTLSSERASSFTVPSTATTAAAPLFPLCDAATSRPDPISVIARETEEVEEEKEDGHTEKTNAAAASSSSSMLGHSLDTASPLHRGKGGGGKGKDGTMIWEKKRKLRGRNEVRVTTHPSPSSSRTSRDSSRDSNRTSSHPRRRRDRESHSSSISSPSSSSLSGSSIPHWRSKTAVLRTTRHTVSPPPFGLLGTTSSSLPPPLAPAAPDTATTPTDPFRSTTTTSALLLLQDGPPPFSLPEDEMKKDEKEGEGTAAEVPTHPLQRHHQVKDTGLVLHDEHTSVKEQEGRPLGTVPPSPPSYASLPVTSSMFLYATDLQTTAVEGSPVTSTVVVPVEATAAGKGGEEGKKQDAAGGEEVLPVSPLLSSFSPGAQGSQGTKQKRTPEMGTRSCEGSSVSLHTPTSTSTYSSSSSTTSSSSSLSSSSASRSHYKRALRKHRIQEEMARQMGQQNCWKWAVQNPTALVTVLGNYMPQNTYRWKMEQVVKPFEGEIYSEGSQTSIVFGTLQSSDEGHSSSRSHSRRSSRSGVREDFSVHSGGGSSREGSTFRSHSVLYSDSTSSTTSSSSSTVLSHRWNERMLPRYKAPSSAYSHESRREEIIHCSGPHSALAYPTSSSSLSLPSSFSHHRHRHHRHRHQHHRHRRAHTPSQDQGAFPHLSSSPLYRLKYTERDKNVAANTLERNGVVTERVVTDTLLLSPPGKGTLADAVCPLSTPMTRSMAPSDHSPRLHAMSTGKREALPRVLSFPPASPFREGVVLLPPSALTMSFPPQTGARGEDGTRNHMAHTVPHCDTNTPTRATEPWKNTNTVENFPPPILLPRPNSSGPLSVTSVEDCSSLSTSAHPTSAIARSVPACHHPPAAEKRLLLHQQREVDASQEPNETCGSTLPADTLSIPLSSPALPSPSLPLRQGVLIQGGTPDDTATEAQVAATVKGILPTTAYSHRGEAEAGPSQVSPREKVLQERLPPAALQVEHWRSTTGDGDPRHALEEDHRGKGRRLQKEGRMESSLSIRSSSGGGGSTWSVSRSRSDRGRWKRKKKKEKDVHDHRSAHHPHPSHLHRRHPHRSSSSSSSSHSSSSSSSSSHSSSSSSQDTVHSRPRGIHHHGHRYTSKEHSFSSSTSSRDRRSSFRSSEHSSGSSSSSSRTSSSSSRHRGRKHHRHRRFYRLPHEQRAKEFRDDIHGDPRPDRYDRWTPQEMQAWYASGGGGHGEEDKRRIGGVGDERHGAGKPLPWWNRAKRWFGLHPTSREHGHWMAHAKGKEGWYGEPPQRHPIPRTGHRLSTLLVGEEESRGNTTSGRSSSTSSAASSQQHDLTRHFVEVSRRKKGWLDYSAPSDMIVGSSDGPSSWSASRKAELEEHGEVEGEGEVTPTRRGGECKGKRRDSFLPHASDALDPEDGKKPETALDSSFFSHAPKPPCSSHPHRRHGHHPPHHGHSSSQVSMEGGGRGVSGDGHAMHFGNGKGAPHRAPGSMRMISYGKILSSTRQRDENSAFYDAYFLDSGLITFGERRRKNIVFPGYRTTIISFVEKKVLKKDLNAHFYIQHPYLEVREIKLTQLRKIRHELLQYVLEERSPLELSTVAHAYWFFERLTEQGMVGKKNRKVVLAACVMLAIKLLETGDTRMKVEYFRQRWLRFHKAAASGGGPGGAVAAAASSESGTGERVGPTAEEKEEEKAATVDWKEVKSIEFNVFVGLDFTLLPDKGSTVVKSHLERLLQQINVTSTEYFSKQFQAPELFRGSEYYSIYYS